MSRSIQALIEAGEWREAAGLCEVEGDLGQAEGLYLKMLDRRSAARVAAREGRTVDAMRHLLDGRHREEAEALRREMMAQLDEGLESLIGLYDRHRDHLQAAEIAASLGHLDAAAERYEQGLAALEAARLRARMGRWREAERLYRLHLQSDPSSLEASVGLGRVLQRFDRHEEALAPLSMARAQTRASGRREDEAWVTQWLAYGLTRLGWEEAARVCLGREDVGGFVEAFEARHEEASRDALGERYRVSGLAEGGIEGYVAQDLLRGQEVLLQPLWGGMEGRRRYAQALEALSEPRLSGALPMLDRDAGLRFVVLDSPPSSTLSEWMDEGPPMGALRGVMTQLVTIVEASHRRGVLHGHLHPGVVFVGAGGSVCVGGFGQDRLGARQETRTQGGGADSPLRYLPPEAAFGGGVDLRADFYGLGALLYRALSGEAPSPGVWEAPEAWRGVLSVLLSANPDARPGNHAALKQALAGGAWSVGSVFKRARAARVVKASEAERFEVVGEEGALVRVRDRWLGREALWLGWEGALDADGRERLRALCQPGVGVVQRVLKAELEEGRLLLEVVEGRAVLEGSEGVGWEARLQWLRHFMEALVQLHEQGAALGGFEASQVRIDARGEVRLVMAPALRRAIEGPEGRVDEDEASFGVLAEALLEGRGLAEVVEALAAEVKVGGARMRAAVEGLRGATSVAEARPWLSRALESVGRARARARWVS